MKNRYWIHCMQHMPKRPTRSSPAALLSLSMADLMEIHGAATDSTSISICRLHIW